MAIWFYSVGTLKIDFVVTAVTGWKSLNPHPFGPDAVIAYPCFSLDHGMSNSVVSKLHFVKGARSNRFKQRHLCMGSALLKRATLFSCSFAMRLALNELVTKLVLSGLLSRRSSDLIYSYLCL